MNEYLKQFLLPVLCAAVFLAFGSCREDTPVQQPPITDTVKSAPTGMPDWNDPQHDWIRTRDSLCGLRDITKDYWTPKFSFIVMDASPDGKRILLSLGDQVVMYDTAMREVLTVFPFGCEFAAWSHDGKYIAGFTRYPAIQKCIAFYEVGTGRQTFASFADSIEDAITIGTWLPGDTTLDVGILTKSVSRSYSCAMKISPPYTLSRMPDPYYDIYSGTIGLSVDGPDPMTRLRIGSIGVLDSMRAYPLPVGVLRANGFYRISPDGNWLAFRMDADMTGSRINTAASVTSLGIIDLRPGSPTQYQLYRVFPDYTNTYRNCSAAWFFSGVAWSGDGKYVYHEQVRISDSTTQIVRRNVRTGKEEAITNFLAPP